MQNRPLPIKAYSKETPDDLRALRVARIARQIQEGAYRVPGREIARKLLLREQLGGCCSS